MKKCIIVLSLIGMLSILSSCSAGYVSQEPEYRYHDRPQSPGRGYIWIDGGWNWNNRSNSYIQTNGNWQKHRQGRMYRQGHWKKNRHGSQWIRGSYR